MSSSLKITNYNMALGRIVLAVVVFLLSVPAALFMLVRLIIWEKPTAGELLSGPLGCLIGFAFFAALAFGMVLFGRQIVLWAAFADDIILRKVGKTLAYRYDDLKEATFSTYRSQLWGFIPSPIAHRLVTFIFKDNTRVELRLSAPRQSQLVEHLQQHNVGGLVKHIGMVEGTL